MQVFRSRLQPSVPGALALVFTCLLAFLALHQRALAEVHVSSLGIGPTIASQFAPAVVEYLGTLGFSKERDILARILD